MSVDETLGDRIRQKREEHGWTQRELARRSRVDVSWINRLESGERSNISLEAATRLARVLGVTLDYLAGRYRTGELEPAGVALVAAEHHAGSTILSGENGTAIMPQLAER